METERDLVGNVRNKGASQSGEAEKLISLEL